MDFILRTLLIICCSPILIYGLHVGLQRGAQWLRWKLPAQIGAFMAIFCAFIPIAYVLWRNAADRPAVYAEDAFCVLIYFVLVYLMIGYLYISFLNLSDTSLHIHILMEIALAGQLALSSLEQEYNKDTMVDAKIHRLISLGLLRDEKGQLYSANKGYLYYGYLFDVWRRVMGVPTEPKRE